jgi:DNA-binding transcriptional ArsR family regulator
MKTDLDAVFKALADPTRRRLLDQLHRDNGQTLTALSEHMDMTRQAVTQHLQLLTTPISSPSSGRAGKSSTT